MGACVTLVIMHRLEPDAAEIAAVLGPDPGEAFTGKPVAEAVPDARFAAEFLDVAGPVLVQRRQRLAPELVAGVGVAGLLDPLMQWCFCNCCDAIASSELGHSRRFGCTPANSGPAQSRHRVKDRVAAARADR